MERQVLFDTKDVQIVLEKFNEAGFLFERERKVVNGEPEGPGLLVATSENAGLGRRIALGDHVISNGRFKFKRAGLRGIVVGIYLPFQEGRTSDIIDVLFEGRTIGKPFPTAMKFKDLG